MAITQINEVEHGFQVGGKRYFFDPVVRDDGYTADQAIPVLNSFIDQGIKITYTFGSGPAVAAIPAAYKAGMFHIVSAWGQPPHFAGDRQFTVGTPTFITTPLFLDAILKVKPDAKRFIIVNDTTATGTGAAKDQKEALKSRGLQLVDEEYYEVGIKDFHPLAAKIMATPSDGLLSAVKAGDFALLLKALRELGYTGQISTESFLQGIPIAGAAASEGVFTNEWDPTDVKLPPAIVKFSTAYKNRFGTNIESMSNIGWDIVMATKAAIIGAGGTDPDKMGQYLENGGKFDSLAGPATFTRFKADDATRSHYYATFISVAKITNGKPVNFFVPSGPQPIPGF